MEPVLLWVKAGIDGTRLGGDPLCHQIFMILIEKSLDPDSKLKFNAKTVNEAKPPPEFQEAGVRHAPMLQHGDIVLSHPDEIIDYIDRVYPVPSLKCDCSAASDATADLFRAFAFFIKQVNNDSKGLETELIRLNRYLEESDFQFLGANRITHLDCYILPKLHTIRVAAKALKNFDIPTDLQHLWKYMSRGYLSESFRKSCPSDQEIIIYWADRADTPNLSSNKLSQLYRQKLTYSMDQIPSSTNSHGEEIERNHLL